ncbi:MAG: D-aminoacyl-tRNA deacylase [Actinomycetaceae bacterium]|nr:D-aminoacyl-tRNA deacylase [Actinomycetaceae bacterium]
MRAIIQRVTRGYVHIEGEDSRGFSGPGVVVLLGVTHGDGQAQVDKVVRKIAELRLFEDETSVTDRGAPVLLVSQFTLYGNTRKGRRPSWSGAAPGPVAQPLYEQVVAGLRDRGLTVYTGTFGAMMRIEMVNDGPFTLLVEA